MNNSQNSIQVQQQPHPTQPNQLQGQHANFPVQNQQPAQQPPQQTTVQNVQQPQNVQQAPSSQSHMTNNPMALTNQEMLNKTKKLIADLKESLANLMNLAAKNISYNYQIDSGQKINMEKCSRFNKSWGEFNSICNQVETHFKTFQECSLLRKESKNYMPFSLASLNQIEQSSVGNETLISYNQYVTLVKNQVHYTKQIQDILTDGARKISQMEIQPAVQQANVHGQHGYHPMQQQQQQSNLMSQQHQMQQQHPYHTQPHSNQMPNQSPMSNHQSPIANHQSPISQSMGQSPMMSQQMMMGQQRGPMSQMGSQMNSQMNNQMAGQMPVHQQPMMQQMHGQMNNQMNNQMNSNQMMKSQHPM